MRLPAFGPAGSRVPPLEVAGLVFLRRDCVPAVSGAQIAQMTTPGSLTFGMPTVSYTHLTLPTTPYV